MGRLAAADFETILKRCHPDTEPEVYIETGTRYGVQLSIAAQEFRHCYGIELDSYCYQRSRDATALLPHVEMRQGDSRQVLPRLCTLLRVPVFFLLDAHYNRQNPPIPKTEFPLWDELTIIRARGQADIVVVDDSHTFGRERPTLKYTPDAVEWEGVTRETLRGFFGTERIAETADVGGGYVMWLRGVNHAYRE